MESKNFFDIINRCVGMIQHVEKTGDLRVTMDPDNQEALACLGGIVLGNDGLRVEVSAMLGTVLKMPDLPAQIRAGMEKKGMPLTIDDDGTMTMVGD